jgi:Mg/Co/Ni transporter MgtE
VYYIYVVDAQQLVGVLSLRELLLAPPGAKLSELMETNLKTVSPEEDELKVAQMLAKYNLVALPVVDEAGRLMGIVTVDDVMDLLLPQRRKRRAI